MPYNSKDSADFQDKALSLITAGLEIADLFISKNYLIDLNNYPAIPIDDTEKSFAFLNLFEVTKLVFDKSENINDKLVSVYSALSNYGSTAILIIAGSKNGVRFFIGSKDIHRPDIAKSILQKSLKGHFPGIKMNDMPVQNIQNTLTKMIPEKYSSYAVSSVSVVPGLRHKDKEGYVQGLEKFIDSMAGETYTAVLISKPKTKSELDTVKRGYEELYSALSQCEQTNMTYSENQSESVAKSISDNFVKSISNGVSKSLTQSSSDSRSINRGKNHGHSFGFFGIGFNGGTTSGTGKTYSTNYGTTDGENTSESESQGKTETSSDTAAKGSSLSLTVTSKNKTVKDLTEKIDRQLKRIRSCESYGLWDTACYFIAPEQEVCIVAANTFKALVSGEETAVEDSFVNNWSGEYDDMNDTMTVMECIRYGTHPRFNYVQKDKQGILKAQVVTPASLVSGIEMSVVMGFPYKSVNGLVSVSSAEFGRNVYTDQIPSIYKNVELGSVYHMGEVEKENRVKLDLNSLTSHCFITGSTGSGKSNTIYKIIEELCSRKNNIKFLAIEPAKGEYKNEFYKMPGIQIFTTNPRFCSMLSINPFEFNEKVHILEHLDRLIEIFSACWPLYAAMPALLKASFEQAYIVHGWDLEHSIYFDKGNGKYPNFRDIVDILPKLLDESEFSAETKGDYIGSLVTRVQSLTNGLIGQIFNGYPIEDRVIFDNNTIIDISRIGSAETKALIMGTMILKLNEYRQSETVGSNLPLQHVTILEEAHNLLKRTSTEQGQESSNVQGKSVEMISNSIAEMRTYGEGFIIVDQSPTAVDISAIKNTNTKIIMRLPEKEDRESAGYSVGLTEEQINELSRLDKGVAVIYQNNWLEAVQTKIDRCSNAYEVEIIPENSRNDKMILVGQLLNELVTEELRHFYVLARMEKIVDSSSVNIEVKSRHKILLREYNKLFRTSNKQEAFDSLIYNLLECEPLYKSFEDTIPINEYMEFPSADIQRKCKAWCDVIYSHLDKYAVFASKQVKDICFFSTLIHRTAQEVKKPKYGYLLCCLSKNV